MRQQALLLRQPDQHEHEGMADREQLLRTGGLAAGWVRWAALSAALGRN